MGSSVTLVDADSATKPLSEFMLNRRVGVPVSADAPGRPGDWSIDGEKLYFCLGPDDWSAIALVRVSGSVEAADDVVTGSEDLDDANTDSDPAEGADASGSDDASAESEASVDASDEISAEEVK